MVPVVKSAGQEGEHIVDLEITPEGSFVVVQFGSIGSQEPGSTQIYVFEIDVP